MFLISLLYIIYEDGPKTGARSFLNCQKLQKNGGQKGPKPQKKKTQALSSNQHKNQVNGAKTKNHPFLRNSPSGTIFRNGSQQFFVELNRQSTAYLNESKPRGNGKFHGHLSSVIGVEGKALGPK
jgi:hypothetical protein